MHPRDALCRSFALVANTDPTGSFKCVSAHVSLMTDSTDDDGPRCDNCGDPIEASPNRRVVTNLEDGEAAYSNFCDDDCLEEWRS